MTLACVWNCPIFQLKILSTKNCLTVVDAVMGNRPWSWTLIMMGVVSFCITTTLGLWYSLLDWKIASMCRRSNNVPKWYTVVDILLRRTVGMCWQDCAMRQCRRGHQLEHVYKPKCALSKNHTVIVEVLLQFVMVKETCFWTVWFGGLFGLGLLAKSCSGLSVFGSMISSGAMQDPPCSRGYANTSHAKTGWWVLLDAGNGWTHALWLWRP